MNKKLLIIIGYLLSLIVVGISLSKRWDVSWGIFVTSLLLLLSIRWVLKLGNKKKDKPRIDNYDITQEDLEGDLHEGRD